MWHAVANGVLRASGAEWPELQRAATTAWKASGKGDFIKLEELLCACSSRISGYFCCTACATFLSALLRAKWNAPFSESKLSPDPLAVGLKAKRAEERTARHDPHLDQTLAMAHAKEAKDVLQRILATLTNQY